MRKSVAQLVLLGASLTMSATGQSVTVTGNVAIIREGRPTNSKPDNGNVVVWLRPAGGVPPRAKDAPRPKFEIKQQHKHFDPRILPVPIGSVVSFPNLDPFFHNVFSMFDGKRFDLGLYEAGKVPSVTFDRAGVCYLFCNIHPEMSAVVVVVDAPYFATSNAAGDFSMPNVAPGRYQLSLWHEHAKPEIASEFPRDVTVGAENTALRPIRLTDPEQILAPHKNKFGHDYETPPPSSPIYK